MDERMKFEGKIVRVERDGFGVVEFDRALNGRTHGFFSNTASERLPPLKQLKAGLTVSGLAEPGDKDIAAVKRMDLTASGF